MEFREVVRKRRMVRSFTDEPVDHDAVERILDVARRGPSAGYSQGVEFVVITEPLVRAAVSVRSGRLNDAELPNFVTQAPVVILVCTTAERYRSRYRESDKARARGDAADDDWWLVPYWHTDAGAAMMLILLATVDEGLSAGVAGVMGAEGQARVRRAVGMPATYTAVALIAIGHAAADAKGLRGSARTRKRRPLDDVVHRNRW